VCLEDETVFLPIPVDLRSMLVRATVKALSRTQGDNESWQILRADMQDDIAAIMKAPGHRTDGNPKVMKIRNQLVRGGRRANSVND
jgi:hypothetical protein